MANGRTRRSRSTHTIYTVGYQGRDLDGLLAALSEHQIELVVDVRLTPISRKRGFSKRLLGEALGQEGIKYVHAPELGNPKENRAVFQTKEQVGIGKRRYRARLANGSRARFDEVVAHSRESRVALLCFESDPEQCHRSCITDLAAEEDPSITVKAIS